MAQIIHGTMKKGGAPATLLVLQFVFAPGSNARRFKNAKITMTFSAGHVVQISPYNKYFMFKSTTERKLSRSLSPSLEGAFGPAKASVGYTWKLERTRDRRRLRQSRGHHAAAGAEQRRGIQEDQHGQMDAKREQEHASPQRHPKLRADGGAAGEEKGQRAVRRRD
ncbi:hypothetical protein B0T24DRAFT_325439 [Lasiosphaeria ovina]|uniref:Uncharacterized protein n=1 Tax=Lasiosphaeria ovina TaxID=92902 RepID=A0AAE0K7I8_9PEZI|nr:hypothetical protein B0T24DRAFT_325439 [Lasiosphaeria ovina]